MKKNQEFTVECTDLTREGYGAAKVEGIPVFINGLLPGEKACIKIIKAAKSYAIGRLLERFNDSPRRTAPICPAFGKCGGCTLQHLQYDEQLKQKQRWMEQLFHAVDPAIDVRPVIGMENPYAYRNKAQFPVQVKGGRVRLGFYRPHSNDIVESRTCYIQDELINRIYQWLQDHLTIAQAQNLRHILIRTSQMDEAQVVFIGRRMKDVQGLAAPLVESFPEIQGVLFNHNDRNDNVILGDTYKVLYGSDELKQTCRNNEIRLHFKSFFQVNPRQMERLYEEALKLADLQPDQTVIDLYSGTGTIALAAAEKAGQVIGVEIVPEAVENARANAHINQVENVRFVCQDASEFAAEFSHGSKKADVLIVDPPRKGLTAQGLADICQIAPEKIIYISCGPQSLARDLRLFYEKGYECRLIQPVDMFAQTNGLENIACLVRKDS